TCNAWPCEFLHCLPLFPDHVIRLYCTKVQNRRKPERKKPIPHTLALHAELCQVAHAVIREDEIDESDVPAGFCDSSHFAHYAFAVLTGAQLMNHEVRYHDVKARFREPH